MTALQPRAPARRSCLAGVAGEWRGLGQAEGAGSSPPMMQEQTGSLGGGLRSLQWHRAFLSLRVLPWLQPSRSGSEWLALRTPGAFYTPPPPASRRVSSSPRRLGTPSPFLSRTRRSPPSWHSRTSISQSSKPISHPGPLRAPLVTDIKINKQTFLARLTFPHSARILPSCSLCPK